MTAKEYLSEIRKYNRIAISLAEQVDIIRNEIGGLKGIAYDKDRVQTSPSNRMEELIPKLIKAEEQYTESLIKYRMEYLKRVRQIVELGNPEYVEVLQLRYIEQDDKGHTLDWHEIANRMNWSYSKVTHLHGYALQAFSKKYLQTCAN